MTTLVDTQDLVLSRVRTSRPGAVSLAVGSVATANAQPRLLSGISMPAVPAPVYAVAPSTCGWQRMTEGQDRGTFRADAIAQGGRLTGSGDAYVITFKHSTRSGPPPCSPTA